MRWRIENELFATLGHPAASSPPPIRPSCPPCLFQTQGPHSFVLPFGPNASGFDVPVHGLAARTVPSSEVSALGHEALDHAVKDRPFIVERMPRQGADTALASTKGPEILRGSWGLLSEELYGYERKGWWRVKGREQVRDKASFMRFNFGIRLECARKMDQWDSRKCEKSRSGFVKTQS